MDLFDGPSEQGRLTHCAVVAAGHCGKRVAGPGKKYSL